MKEPSVEEQIDIFFSKWHGSNGLDNSRNEDTQWDSPEYDMRKELDAILATQQAQMREKLIGDIYAEITDYIVRINPEYFNSAGVMRTQILTLVKDLEKDKMRKNHKEKE